MKKLIFFSITLLILMCSEYAISGPCDVEGQNCDIWRDAGEPYIYHLPGYPNCDIEIHYQYKVCNGITYFDLVMIAMDNTLECQQVFNLLVPNGLGSYADQTMLGVVWRDAFSKIAELWFMARHAENPNQFNCPITYQYKTIMEGGCASWRYAWKEQVSNPTRMLFVPVPCETRMDAVTN